jgi:uncharacterized spore protein YtfJ
LARNGAAGEARDLHESERHLGAGVGGEARVRPEADLIVIQDELDFPLGTIADSDAAEFGGA